MRLLILSFLFLRLNVYAQDSELIIRQGHKKAINVVTYSVDGQYVLSAGEDKVIKMWDVKTGIDIKTFSGHTAPINCLELTNDGKQMISGDQDGNIFIWEIGGNTKPTLTISGHEGAVNTIKIKPDQQSFLSGGKDELIKEWNFEGDTIKSIRAMTSEIRAIGIHPSGNLAIVGGQKTNDVELLIIDLNTGEITDDALKHYKSAGLAKAYTYAVLSGFSIVSNIAKGNIGKDMLDFYIMNYNNIEYRKDGKSALISQNMFIPLAAAKDEEERTGGTVVTIVEFTDDGRQFVDVKRPQRWQIAYPQTRALFNQDQTHIIANLRNSINVYDMENARFPEGDRKESMAYEPPKVKEFTGDVSWLNSIAMSPDYRTVASADEDRKIKLWDMETGRILRSLEGYVQPALAVDIMPDGKHILVGSLDRDLTMWDVTTGRLVRTFDRSTDITSIDISANGRYFVTSAQNTRFFKVWNFSTGRLLRSVLDKKQDFTWVRFESAPDYVYAMTEDEDLRLWEVRESKSKKAKASFEELEDKYRQHGYTISWDGYDLQLKKEGAIVLKEVQGGLITDAVFSQDGKRLITTNEQGEIAIYSLENYKKLVSMSLINNNDYVTYTPDFYYTSSKNAARSVAFKSGNTVLPFEQFELKFNRPDIIAERLGFASKKLVTSYRAAYLKRLKRLGMTEADLDGKLVMPVVTPDYNNIPLASNESSFSFNVSAKDETIGLKSLQVYVNDVAIYPSEGVDGQSGPGEIIQKTFSLELSAGINEIKVIATNKNGLESLPETFEVKYNAPYFKPDLYLISIGVSTYRQSNYNLTFAAKDAKDMAATLSSSTSFENVYSKVITNQQATRDQINGLRPFLEQAGVDDVVIVFIAGHGVLDSDYNYYFATHDMDFNDPAGLGLSYDAIEKLIDGLKCRNKGLFMDTCHSGELDKEDVEAANESIVEAGAVAFRSAGKLVQLKENSFGLENTLELSKTLFGDLKKGTGATIISAAGGTEFAMEGLNSSNGLFTSCLIQGIETRMADIDRNRKYSISELQRYVSEQVIYHSQGKQVPTSREENLSNDFTVY